jgi:HD-GYP domain-containing protein (c-di-GMP phosphodiesterase class II)
MYARNKETEEHALRIAEICKKIGERLLLNKQQLDELYLCSILHDIGKVSIDDRILNKLSRLNDREWNIMKMHPEIGYRIAKSVPEIASIAEYIYFHHERLDGTGYPCGLKGEEIPLLSRILAVADAYDAMTEGRIYKKAISYEEAAEEIRKNAGGQFDPNIVEIFLEIIKK